MGFKWLSNGKIQKRSIVRERLVQKEIVEESKDYKVEDQVCNTLCDAFNPQCPSPDEQDFSRLKTKDTTESLYFDVNASHIIEQEVAEYMSTLYKFPGNASSNHIAGKKLRMYIEDTRKKLAIYLGCKESTLYFTSGGTESNNTFIKGMASAAYKVSTPFKNKIIISSTEHKSVVNVAKSLDKLGFKCIEIPVDKQGIIKEEALKKELDCNTLLVSIIHTNNETGVVQNIDRLCSLVKKKGIVFHSDMSQSLGKVDLLPSITQLDAATFSAHKFGGPVGVGILYLRDRESIDSLLYGGNQEFSMRPGTYNTVGIAGLGKAIELLERINIQSIFETRNYLESKLVEEFNCTIVGQKVARAINTSSVTFNGVNNEDITKRLSEKGIYISYSSACTAYSKDYSHVLKAVGLSESQARSTLRISIDRHINRNNVDSFVSVLSKLIGGK